MLLWKRKIENDTPAAIEDYPEEMLQKLLSQHVTRRSRKINVEPNNGKNAFVVARPPSAMPESFLQEAAPGNWAN
jgi:hypothetical protein